MTSQPKAEDKKPLELFNHCFENVINKKVDHINPSVFRTAEETASKAHSAA